MPIDDIAISDVPHKPLVRVMMQRIAPFVGLGLIGFDEALDMLMQECVRRGLCDTPAMQTDLQGWIGRALTKEAALPVSGTIPAMAADAARGVAKARQS